MDIIKIKIEQKGKDIAEATAKIIKQNTMFRQLFIPEIVNNPNSKEKSLRARIVVQRKKPSEGWENFDTLKQTDLKSGGWLNLDIDSNSLDIILAYCNELKRIYAEEGQSNIFNSNRVIVVGKNNDKEDVEQLLELIKENPNANEVFEKINQKNISIENVIKFIEENSENLENIISDISASSSDVLYNNLITKFINTKYLKYNLNNDSEEFWQNLFASNPRIITSVIPSVLTLINNKPYVGGKAITNRGGNFSDYIFGCGPNNISLIEIKTPCTQLMKAQEYRTNVYSPSDDLAGAVIQLRNQKDLFTKNYYNLQAASAEEGISFKSYDPKCYLIIGNNDSLNTYQSKSFELFRHELKDIEIITFDELIKKLDLISNALTQ